MKNSVSLPYSLCLTTLFVLTFSSFAVAQQLPREQWGAPPVGAIGTVMCLGLSKRMPIEVYARRPLHVSMCVAVSVIAEWMRGAVPTLARWRRSASFIVPCAVAVALPQFLQRTCSMTAVPSQK